MIQHNRHLVRLILVSAFLLSSMSCSTLSSNRYLKNRVLDLADVFNIELTYGPGALIAGNVTRLVGTGIGTSDQEGWMMEGRYLGHGRRESGGILLCYGSNCDFPYPSDQNVSKILGSVVDKHDRSDSLSITTDPEFYLLGINPPLPGPCEIPYIVNLIIEPSKYGLYALDSSIGVSALCGVHIGLSPGELLDFILGWTTLDLAGDDEPGGKPQSSSPGTSHP